MVTEKSTYPSVWSAIGICINRIYIGWERMSFSKTSLICRGLRDFEKRKDVFGYLRNLNCNIYCLQDTHIVDNDERLIRAQWGYNISMSLGRTDSRGVLNLFYNNFEYEITKSYKDAVGNLLILSIIINKKLSIALVNIYGPHNNHPEFYRNLKRKLKEFYIIMIFLSFLGTGIWFKFFFGLF